MPIAINGSGTITGLSTGGLPDGSVDADTLASNAVTTAKINAGAVTTAKINDDAVTDAKQNLSGAAKAWVNFNGSGTVAIRDSFNVSSITDNSTGYYTINFTNNMANANYCLQLSATDDGTTLNITSGYHYGAWKAGSYVNSQTTSSAEIKLGYGANTTFYDESHVMVAVFGD